MKKVYITSLHFKHGGIEKSIASLANALDEKGFGVEILCTYDLGKPAYRLNETVKIRYLTAVRPNRSQVTEALKRGRVIRAIKEAAYGVRALRLKRNTMRDSFGRIKEGAIISTRHENNLLLSRYGQADVIKVAQLHSDHGSDRKLLRQIRHGYQRIDYFALLTDQAAEEMKSVMAGVNSHTRVMTIPNFFECDMGEPRDGAWKQVISVGRLHADKNFECMLRVWSRVVPHFPEWKLKIVGDGPLESKLKTLSDELGIQKNVIFTGAAPHDRVIEEMRRSRCYLLTSRFESFGIALLEAMSCGTPAVAMDVRLGPAYIIEHGVNGYLVQPGDEADFAEKLMALLREDTLFLDFSRAAIRKARMFTKERVIEKWIEILQSARV